MPYDVKKDDRCPASKPWAVVKKDGDELIGCHVSKTKAEAQIEAIGANDNSATPGGHMSGRMENLTRALPEAATVRSDDMAGNGRTLFGHFSVFNTPYEVNSMWEGNFLETIAPGAFTRTIEERGGQIKALYDHGADPELGNKPLGTFTQLSEDDIGGYYEIDLIDTNYNRDFIIPAARAGLLGASFRFSVVAESWVDAPKASKTNPTALPERTITDVNLFELGPVTFPASPSASASLRSTTDEWRERLSDPVFVARMEARYGSGVVRKLLETLTSDGRSAQSSEPADGRHGLPDVCDPQAILALARSLSRS